DPPAVGNVRFSLRLAKALLLVARDLEIPGLLVFAEPGFWQHERALRIIGRFERLGLSSWRKGWPRRGRLLPFYCPTPGNVRLKNKRKGRRNSLLLRPLRLVGATGFEPATS